MRKHILIFLLILILCVTILLASCKDPSNQDKEVGGENDRIRGEYVFSNYEEYETFYNVFIQYNTERYFVPNDKDQSFKFEYTFLSEGVEYSDYQAGKFDIVFGYQTMYVNITYKGDDNYRVEGKCLAFDDKTQMENLEYKITENDGKIFNKDGRLILNIYSGENLIYVGKIKETANRETMDTISKNLLNSFNFGG